MHAIDKSNWAVGEWSNEPDQMNFKTDEGYDAAIIRTSHIGHLCGYVGVPVSHPWFGKSYGDEVKPIEAMLERPIDVDQINIFGAFASAFKGANPEDGIRIDCAICVHGGLTYSDKGDAKYGEDPDLWYFGFDCGHCDDLSPAYEREYMNGTYRNIDYVRHQIEGLSKQLFAIAGAA